MIRTKFISWSVTTLVFLVSVIAFTLSYNALRDVAATNGLPDWRAYAWPLLIDFPLVVFSLAVLWANLNQLSARWPWFLVSVFTVATITFNLIHAPDNLTAQAVAVVAPLALFLSFETLVGMVRNEIRRGLSLESLGAINSQIVTAQEQLTALRQQIKTGVSRRDNLQAEFDRVLQEKEALTLELASLIEEKERMPVRTNDTRQRISEILAENNGGLTSEVIAGMVGVSAGRVRQIRNELAANGKG